MAYSKQNWRNNDSSTPLSAARLNHIENGILAASTAGSAPQSGAEIAPGFADRAGTRARSFTNEVSMVLADATKLVGRKPLVLAEAFEPGVITKFWYAAGFLPAGRDNFAEDNGILKIYLDDDTTPAVDVPLNDFMAYSAHGEPFANQMLGRAANYPDASGGYRNLWAPYHHYMRVELHNTGTADANGVYTAVDILEGDIGEGTYVMKHAKDLAAPLYSELSVPPIVGEGQVEAITYSGGTPTPNSYGFLEANLNITVDNEPIPSVATSGVEDFFAGAWYRMEVGGYPSGIAGRALTEGSWVSMYRFFPHDGIAFTESVTMDIPIGQIGQGSGLNEDGTVPELEVSATVSAWLREAPTPHYTKVGALIHQGNLTSATGWSQAPDRTQATISGGKITFPADREETGTDMRAYRADLNLPAQCFVETTVAITDEPTSTDKTAGLIVGSPGDPWYGSTCHVQVQKDNQHGWKIIVRDDWDTPFSTTIGSGKDLTGVKIQLGVKVEGTTRTAYYRFVGSEFWVPIGSWTTGKEGLTVGVMSWQAAAEFSTFSVRGLDEV